MTLNRHWVQLTDRQLGWLRSESERLGLSVSELVRRALDSVIDGGETLEERVEECEQRLNVLDQELATEERICQLEHRIEKIEVEAKRLNNRTIGQMRLR